MTKKGVAQGTRKSRIRKPDKKWRRKMKYDDTSSEELKRMQMEVLGMLECPECLSLFLPEQMDCPMCSTNQCHHTQRPPKHP